MSPAESYYNSMCWPLVVLCRTCGGSASRIKVIDGVDICTNCGLVETGGSKIDGSITRNSFRIREQQKQYASDLEPPYTWDKAKHKAVPNSNFIRNFPKQAEKTFTLVELKSVGVTKLKGKA